MSDSLLNLLEVLNEVLEEQKLQEQASGGAPTEQELWDIVSPGLGTYINNHYTDYINLVKEKEFGQGYDSATRGKIKNIDRKRRVLISGLREQESKFAVAFGVLNHQRAQEKNIDQKLQKISSWLSDLNDFYAANEGSGAVVNFYVLESIVEGFSFGVIKNNANNENPTTIKTKSNTQLIKGLLPSLESLINISNSGQIGPKLFKLFIKNLQNGKPVLSFYKSKGTPEQYSTAPAFERDFHILDFQDFENLIKISKNGDLSKTIDFLTKTNNIKNKLLQTIYIKKIESSYDEIFQFFLENPNELVKHSGSIKSALAAFVLKYSNKKKNNYGDFVYPEYTNFINKWISVFSDQYDDIVKKAYADDNLGKSISGPSIKTSRGSLSKGFNETLDIFFGDATGFKERIDIFNEKMNIFTLPKEKFENLLKNVDILDFMNRIFLMDYFVEFSKGFSAPIAGLMFEYFLAGLVGGKAIGQRGGVVDFQVGDSLGSAKFLSSLKYATQSAKTFQVEEVLGKKVTYMIGLKKDSGFKLEDSAVAPLEIQEVDIYTFDIIHKGELVFSVDDGEDEDLKNEKRENKNLSLVSGEIRFNKILEEKSPEATIKVMSTDGKSIKTYRQTLDAMLETEDKETLKLERDVLSKVKEIFDNIKGGESAARSYAQTGDLEKGQSAMKQLSSSREAITDLSTFSEKYKLKAAADDT